jgi:hypothetical protein
METQQLTPLLPTYSQKDVQGSEEFKILSKELFQAELSLNFKELSVIFITLP